MRAGWAFLLIVVVGCGDVSSTTTDAGDGDGDGDGDAGIDAPAGDPCSAATISVADLKECYTRAFCRIGTECTNAVFASTDDCETIIFDYYRNIGFDLEFLLDQLIAAITTGNTTYDGTAVAECLFGNTCDTQSVACLEVVSGIKTQGQACFGANECLPGGFCDIPGNPTMQCAAGTCVDPVGLNQPCPSFNCERGLICANDVTGLRRCVSGDVGTPCTADFECDQQLQCDENGTGTCVARVAEGQACADSSNCVAPLSCVDSVCSRPDADGEGCESSCLGPLFCDQSGGLSVCRPLPVAGQSCAVSDRCLGAHLDCRNGVCVALEAEGAACNNDNLSCDLGLACIANVCSQPSANGAGCQADSECDSFVCEGAGAQVCQAADLCYE